MILLVRPGNGGRAVHILDVRDVRQRHRAAGGGGEDNSFDLVDGIIVRLRIADFHVHALPVHVDLPGRGAPHQAVDAAAHLGCGNSCRLCLDGIHLDLQHRRTVVETGVDLGHIVPLLQRVADFVDHLLHVLIVRALQDDRIGVPEAGHHAHGGTCLDRDLAVRDVCQLVPPLVRHLCGGHLPVILKICIDPARGAAHAAAEARHPGIQIRMRGNDVLDLGQKLVHFFHPESRTGRHGDADLSLVVGSHQLHLKVHSGIDRDPEKRHRDQHDQRFMLQDAPHQDTVAFLHPVDRTGQRCVVLLFGPVHQIAEGDDRDRGEQRRDHTEYDREAQGGKHLPRHARDHGQRNEHDAGRHGRAHDGQGHQVRALQRVLRIVGESTVPALRRAETALQNNDGVVDHHADAQCQGAHGNDVQGIAPPGQKDQGCQDRERDAGADDQGCLQISEEEPDNDHGNDDCQDQGLDHGGQRVKDLVRGIPDHRDMQVRIILQQGVDDFLYVSGELHIRGILLLRDGDGNGRVPVVAGYRGDLFLTEADVGDVL